MSMIELDALEALIKALDTSDRGWSAESVLTAIRHLDDAGWQLTRKPPPEEIITSVVMQPDDTKWPPAGISGHLFSIVGGQAKVILNRTELEYAASQKRELVAANNASDAIAVYDIKGSIDHFTLDGVVYDYRWDNIPF